MFNIPYFVTCMLYKKYLLSTNLTAKKTSWIQKLKVTHGVKLDFRSEHGKIEKTRKIASRKSVVLIAKTFF